MQDTNNNVFRLVRIIFSGSLLCSIILLGYLSWIEYTWFFVLAGFVVICVILLYIMHGLYKKEKSIEWFLTVAVFNILLIVPELGLRSIDFQYAYEFGIQFGYPRRINFVNFVPDSKLFWKLPASAEGVNSLGFPGDEIDIPKKDKVYRIIFLGDSCTAQGYPHIVASLLKENQPCQGGAYESVNLSISGYSSYQGRVLADLYASKLEPDLIVIYYGWNDHWLAYGSVDSEKNIFPLPNNLLTIALSAYENIRILQAARKIIHIFSVTQQTKPINEVRVPLHQYRQNLTMIHAIFQRQNIPVMFITAPTAHYRLGVPTPLIKQKFAPDKKFVVARHREYNQTVRMVAAATGAFILDLEAQCNKIENMHEIFKKDGIHFTPYGLEYIAQQIAVFIEKNILLNL